MDAFEFKYLHQISDKNWAFAFHGIHSDDRDKEVKKFFDDANLSTFAFAYDRDAMKVLLNDELFELHDLDVELLKFMGGKVIIDATSFDVAEFAILSTSFQRIGLLDFDVIYAEPSDYKHQGSNGSKAFDLSDKLLGFEEAGIPGISKAIPVDEPKLFIFFMGYEGDRFRNALEFSEFSRKECNLVFGVPAFKFGWEKFSLLSSARSILENNLQDSFLFCGATNILGIYNILVDLREKYSEESFFLVPLGPKPMSLGAIRFLCRDANSSLLYDHPARSINRSVGISGIHLVRGFLS